MSRPRRPETPEEALELLRQVARQLGSSPTRREWSDVRGGAPSVNWYEGIFGSWSKVLRAAGLPARKQGETRAPRGGSRGGGRPPTYGEQECVAALRKFISEHGDAPTLHQWNKGGHTPSARVMQRVFGSWSAAIKAVGHEPRLPMTLLEGVVTEEHIVEAMALVEKGSSVAQASRDLGVPRSSLGREIRRYRKAHGLPPLDLRTGGPSTEELEEQQLADPERARAKWDKTYKPEQT